MDFFTNEDQVAKDFGIQVWGDEEVEITRVDDDSEESTSFQKEADKYFFANLDNQNCGN